MSGLNVRLLNNSIICFIGQWWPISSIREMKNPIVGQGTTGVMKSKNRIKFNQVLFLFGFVAYIIFTTNIKNLIN